MALRNFTLLTLACHSEEESKYLHACQNHTNLSLSYFCSDTNETRDYINLALHLLCLLISSRQCRSYRRLDFFYSNKTNLVQLEDTEIKTERCCSMQCTERTRAMHHSIYFYLYFKSNIVFGVIIDNQIPPRDLFPEYNVVRVGNSGAI